MPAVDSLAKAIGVTRLARLTGLDRCGIEVVGAVRPRGHVLQVSQGKGLDLESARASALGEALELAAAEAPDPFTLRFGPAPADAAWDALGLSIAWVEGRVLGSRRRAWVPAEAVYCPPAGQAWFGPSITTWRSNGLGAHPTSRRAAEEHALLEVLERHGLDQTLPQGWTPNLARARLVRDDGDEFRLRERGFAPFLFDLTPRGSRVPLAGALLFDLESDVVPLTAGYACRRTFAEAAQAALLEAAQSRLTEIHGAREDVLTGVRESGAALLELLSRATPKPAPRRRFQGSLEREVPEGTVVVTLRESPFVVKVVGEGLRCSELL